MEATEQYLNQYGFVHAGVGDNLSAANEPRYLETSAGRVALLAVTSTFHETWIAGEQRPDLIGRPGVNPLRFTAVHHVSSEKMTQLKSIAEAVDLNAAYNLSVKEGFTVAGDPDTFLFGNHLFKESDHEGQVTVPNEKDMARIRKTILEAGRQAQYVLVSVHAHEMKGSAKDQPADFLTVFARACIDAGAHALIGHGPHILRGIEIYNQRPIFYSLGNFIFQNETITRLPADFYEKYGLTHTHTPADAFDARSKNNTRGFGVDPHVWESILPIWTMEGEALTEISLYPIELGFGQPRYSRGWPSLIGNMGILERLQMLSAAFGTEIQIENGVGKIKLAR